MAHPKGADDTGKMPTHRELSLDTATSRGSAWAVLAALLLPFAGFVLGVVYLLRERIGKGLALILLGFVCFGGWAVVGSAALVVGAHRALNEDLNRTRRQPVSIRIGGETLPEYTRRAKANEAKVQACEHEAANATAQRVAKLEACLEHAGE